MAARREKTRIFGETGGHGVPPLQLDSLRHLTLEAKPTHYEENHFVVFLSSVLSGTTIAATQKKAKPLDQIPMGCEGVMARLDLQ